MNFLGIDVGGTKIFAGRYNADLDLQDAHKLKTEADMGREQVLKNLLTSIDQVKDDNTKAIGISWAGFVNGETGQILKAPNIPALDGFVLTDFITEQTGLPCYLENDARCFALGEYHAAQVPAKVCLGIILGTGVGAGLVINGQIFRGANAAASEVGHMTIDGQEIEEIVAGPALHSYFGGDRLSKITNVTPEKFAPKLEALTTWLQSLLLAYDPDRVVIGGGAGLYFWSRFQDEINTSLNKKIEQYPLTFDLYFSDRKNAGAEGAALIAQQ